MTTKEIQTKVNKSLRSLLHEEVKQALPKEVANQVNFTETNDGLLVQPKKEKTRELEQKVLFHLSRFKANVPEDGQNRHFLIPWKKMSYRIVLRHLENLRNEGRVQRFSRGQYNIDLAVQKRQSLASMYRKVLSINARELKGNYTTTLLGKEGMIIPFNPVYLLPQTTSLFKIIYHWRSREHKDKDTAKAEANIWINSFMNNVSVEIGSTGAPFGIRSGKMVTSERQEIGPALLGAMIGKRVSKRKYGVDALVFQSATEIIFRLLTNLIDPESLKSFGDSDIVVKISFNPIEFLRTMSNLKEPFEMGLNREMVRKWGILPSKTYLEPETRKKRVFSDDGL